MMIYELNGGDTVRNFYVDGEIDKGVWVSSDNAYNAATTAAAPPTPGGLVQITPNIFIIIK